MTDPYSPRYGWRLAALMGEQKIRSGTELQRRLADVGYDITSSQITRIIYVRPQQVKTALLDALGEVFGCTMNEIMPVIEPGRAQQDRGAIASPERKKRVRPPKPAVTSESEEDMAGPVVRAFPNPKK